MKVDVFTQKKDSFFLVTVLALGAVWLKSSLGKFSSGDFVENLPATLERFASKNPHSFVVDFIKSVAVPNADFFGNLVLIGEFYVATSLALGALYLLFMKGSRSVMEVFLVVGLLGGAVMNVTFYLAAGWMSPSTESLNLLMLAVEILGLVYCFKFIKD